MQTLCSKCSHDDISKLFYLLPTDHHQHTFTLFANVLITSDHPLCNILILHIFDHFSDNLFLSAQHIWPDKLLSSLSLCFQVLFLFVFPCFHSLRSFIPKTSEHFSEKFSGESIYSKKIVRRFIIQLKKPAFIDKQMLVNFLLLQIERKQRLTSSPHLMKSRYHSI